MYREAEELFRHVCLGAPGFQADLKAISPEAVKRALRRSLEAGQSEGGQSEGDRPGPLGTGTPADVSRAVALLSPAADEWREDLLRKAISLGEQGTRKVQLYAPLYLSNECTNRCVYCGFRFDNPIPRITLTDEEILREAQTLADLGLEEVLLLTGEAPARVGVSHVLHAIDLVRPLFSRLAIEVFPMSEADYGRMVSAGVEGLTVYQETYDVETYRRVHLGGRKRNFQHRLGAPDRAATAGIQRIGIGALLGLADWRFDAMALFLHARYLRRLHPRLELSISFPRLRPNSGGFRVLHPVDDGALFHMMSVLRLLLPDVALVISTRESAELRNFLGGRIAAKMSAGSRTDPGGYHRATESSSSTGIASRSPSAAQFEIHDDRSPEQIAQMLSAQGFEVTGIRRDT